MISNFHVIIVQFTGTVWGISGLIPASALSVYLNKTSDFYRKRLSISAKVSMPLMLGLALFSYRMEKNAFFMANEKQQWGYSNAAKSEAEKAAIMAKMPLYQRGLNWAYDNPFYIIGGGGAILVGGILKEQMGLKHLKVSQRIMHSRIYGQAGVVALLLFTMGFRHYMDKHGRFPEPEELAKFEADKDNFVPPHQM